MLEQMENDQVEKNSGSVREPKDQKVKEKAAPDTPSDTVQLSRRDYEELLRKSEEFTQVQDRYLRSAADFDNAKKRLQKEREEFLKFALEGAIYDLLPILDNFDRALRHADLKDEKIKLLCDGFCLIQKQLMNILAVRGLKRLEALGKPFDPHGQEALGSVLVTDQPEGIVVEELVAGYELNGKLIRPAKVKLSTKKHPGVSDSSEKLEELT